MHIPGLVELTERQEIPKCLILLTGNSNVGKSSYCREFLVERIRSQSDCMYISCTTTEEQLQSWLVGVGVPMTDISTKLHFINPYVRRQTGDQKADLSSILSEMKEILNNPLNLNIGNDVARSA